MEKLRPLKGTQSLYGEAADRFAHVVATFERVRRLYGFGRVEVPMFEMTGVFARTMGETSDVVSKEMWTFESRSEGSVTLRPEFTAGIARAFLSEGWKQYAPMKVATHGAAFRYERPQKGRYRQFHQLDAEVIGSADPMADVELLCFGAQLLEELGIEGVRLKLNTLGDSESRDNWRAALIEHFAAHRSELSEDSQERLEKNPLRILDSKDPRDRPFADSAPTMQLSAEAEDFFGQVKAGLDAAGVAYELDPHLVRGLDYYRHTAFEFVTDQLGAQGTVLAGGRYDGLIEQLGGPHTPAVGWAAGIERLSMLLDHDAKDAIEAAILPMGEEARTYAIRAAQVLREAGIAAEIFWSGKMAKRMSRADAAGAGAALIIGEDEVAAGTVQYKDLRTGEQRQLTPEDTIDPITDLAAEAMLAEWEEGESR
ncbi:histidine--tRNA ligase [Sphingomicrobium aestuariivivum]|uniref:histidine--tRNA ligase n=1 Tax=Sphingomicrobium aestuariivivum TaxID=1582356 RepID=UPI001FD6EFE4|nr:histidine--tRNA ligase [Sphingomicrobium aestuariivivum]MCJ8191258.1 histidine--tRNA ligase [Sphingomicrobium aestuariivivum]